MLVNLNEVLEDAEKRKYAVAAFNTPTLENIMAVIETAEKLNTPVIISHAELHEEIMPLETIGPIMIGAAERAEVPVCVHLDHGEDLDYIAKAVDIGFTSVMYDGSRLPYAENVRNTVRTVEKAAEKGVSVEAEIGIMGGREADAKADSESSEDNYTDPILAERFVKDTGIDALAASFGTAHGFYSKKPELDFDRIRKIKKLVGIPLVMHGGSGVDPEDYKKAITAGIRKINYYSYMAREGVYAVEEMLAEEKVDFFHQLAYAAVERMKKDVERALKIFTA